MTTQNTALVRMLRPRKPARDASHATLEGMADGMFRGPAKHDHNIDLLVRDAVAERLTQARALDGMPEAAVPHLLTHEDGRVGLLVFDGALADALIEQQTLGRVSAAPRVERAVTTIDAALSTGFATSVAKKFDAIASERADQRALVGFQCGRPQIDRAALSLSLEAGHYDVLRVTLDLGPGLKTGQVQLFLPAASGAASPSAGHAPDPAMAALVQSVALKLEVDLPKIPMSLKTLIGLKPEAVIALPPDALAGARLRDGKDYVVARGRLGQLTGHRAIRLDGPAAPPMAAPAQLEPQAGAIVAEPVIAPGPDSSALAQMSAQDDAATAAMLAQGAGGAAGSDLGGIEGEGFATALADIDADLETQ